MNSGSVQADFFLPGIALGFMHVRDALDDGLLNPFVHLVFILIEPIAAKDVATIKKLLSPKVGSKRFRYFRHSSVAHLVRCTDPIAFELVDVSGSLFSEVV
jgi:hypothetical protein